jgi:hypothetical protein
MLATAFAIITLSMAVVMHACIAGLNSAQHRLDHKAARRFTAVFYSLLAVIVGLLFLEIGHWFMQG